MSDELDIITVGESLIELAGSNLLQTDTLEKNVGGDTLCTAVTASELGAKVGYIARVGNDCFKDYFLETWQAEGLDISQVKLVENTNGIYIVIYNNGDKPKYSFYRKKSAGGCIDIDDIKVDYIKNGKIFYATGIVQASSLTAKETIKKAFEISKNNGLITAYKMNFIPQLISKNEAKENFYDLSENLDILMIDFDKEGSAVFDIDSIDNLIKYVWGLGIATIIVKSDTEKGYYIGSTMGTKFIPFYRDEYVDTTGMDDVFAGAFLYGISSGMNEGEAVKLASVASWLQGQKIGLIKSVPKKEDIYSVYKGLL